MFSTAKTKYHPTRRDYIIVALIRVNLIYFLKFRKSSIKFSKMNIIK